MPGDERELVISARNIGKTFRREHGETIHALDNLSLELRRGSLTALVGPDGAGKTTLLRLITGLLPPDEGELNVLGIDVTKEPAQVQARMGYMPQKFGLYEDLSVQENLDLYADLHGVSHEERQKQYRRLMEMTALGPFTKRLAGRLSGGMKQKLGLACTLIRSPALVVLDEPTVGVDPLSRRELWEIIIELVERDGITMLVSTSYLDEAERCKEVIVLHKGKTLAKGTPDEVKQLAAGRTFLVRPTAGQPARDLQVQLTKDARIIDAVPEGGQVRIVREIETESPSTAAKFSDDAAVSPAAPRFEDGFIILLKKQTENTSSVASLKLEKPLARNHDEVIVKVDNLVKTFGAFTAVDQVSFSVRRGEVFGLLGPNGAGKTTTFRMLCGLLPATSGTLEIAGMDLRFARASARERIGYVAQKFSLYGQLTVLENLEFFASAYNLRGSRKRDRIQWAMREFQLASLARLPSAQLPGGYKQRLAMAAALLHEPEILFLDEPTSGADPLARREFWHRITSLAKQDVTVIVTTHFMEEAEYCDHVVIQDAGKVLAKGTPAEIRQQARPAEGREATMEDAFIAIVEAGRQSHPPQQAAKGAAA